MKCKTDSEASAETCVELKSAPSGFPSCLHLHLDLSGRRAVKDKIEVYVHFKVEVAGGETTGDDDDHPDPVTKTPPPSSP